MCKIYHILSYSPILARIKISFIFDLIFLESLKYIPNIVFLIYESKFYYYIISTILIVYIDYLISSFMGYGLNVYIYLIHLYPLVMFYITFNYYYKRHKPLHYIIKIGFVYVFNFCSSSLKLFKFNG